MVLLQLLLLLLLTTLCVEICFAADFSVWQNRTIYQLLTDRFSKPLGSIGQYNNCADLNRYCGGKFVGIEQRLDYIQNMGFDAIWISPIPENTKDGYHGYWMKDLFKINR
jgi:alpha-amylase